MGLGLELDLLFEIKRINEIDLSHYESLKECIGIYKARAFDDASEDKIMNQIELSLGGGVWFIISSGKVFGFLVSAMRLDQYGTFKCFVDYLFVKEEASSKARELSQVGIDWVKSTSIKEIVFVTKRNAEALMKFLPGDWKKSCEVLSLCV